MSGNEYVFSRHIELVGRVNSAIDSGDVTAERRAADILYGFREALETIGINQLIECDLYYIKKGINRPMCCGVFLGKQLEE